MAPRLPEHFTSLVLGIKTERGWSVFKDRSSRFGLTLDEEPGAIARSCQSLQPTTAFAKACDAIEPDTPQLEGGAQIPDRYAVLTSRFRCRR